MFVVIITIIVIVSLSSFVQDIALFYDIAVSRYWDGCWTAMHVNHNWKSLF